jgi:hypothetical protein
MHVCHTFDMEKCVGLQFQSELIYACTKKQLDKVAGVFNGQKGPPYVLILFTLSLLLLIELQR